MLAYWVMFALPACAALTSRPEPLVAHDATAPKRGRVTWLAVAAMYTVVIGLRCAVGADWFSYLGFLDTVSGAGLLEVLAMGDPGYMLMNWASVQLGLGIVGVNLVCGAIFAVGLSVFCRTLPRPWLALAVAVPYLMIVVAMGYSRQGVALGLAMIGIASLSRGAPLRYAFWVVLAATCHKSALLLLPIAALTESRNRLWSLAWVGAAGFLGYRLFLEQSAETLYQNYVEAEYQSQGATIRLAMNVLPAVILIGWSKRFAFSRRDRRLWLWVAAISLALFALLLTTSATTAVDRVGLYMLPLQLAVFAHLPGAIGGGRRREREVTIAVVAYYATVQFVWLNFATHAFAWVPYRFYLFESGI